MLLVLLFELADDLRDPNDRGGGVEDDIMESWKAQATDNNRVVNSRTAAQLRRGRSTVSAVQAGLLACTLRWRARHELLAILSIIEDVISASCYKMKDGWIRL
jgi:hypothetical protein